WLLLCSRLLSFFFSSRRRHTRFSRDWSSDVCSSDLRCPARPCARSASTGRSPLPGGLPLAVVTTDLSSTPREQLLDLIRELAVVHGRVTLSSGKEADYYVDLRRVTLHHRAAPLIGHQLLDLLEERGLGTAEIDAVGGLTLGADPIATALLHAAASRGQDLDAFVVRKAAKAHGMQRQIEGPDVAGRTVVVVEDT